MAEEDETSDELHQITGSPCDEIDPAELFESHIRLEAGQNHVDDGSELDSDREDHVELISSENELSDVPSDGFPSLEGFPYGVTPPRNVRRQKEKFKKEKEKVQALLKSPFSREHASNPSEKAELDRRKKRGSTQLTTERAFQRKLKRGSVDVAFNVSFDSGVHLPDSAKSLEIPSIKIESTSRFMSLDCVCEDSTDGVARTAVTESIPIKRTISRGHPRATRSESDPRSSSSRNYLNPYCPEARMEFYRTFSLLIKLGSLANKQQENQKQHKFADGVERQSSEENKKWQVEFSQALWLELQAWHANRTMEEQDLHLMRARANVEEILDEVINFKVKKQDANTQILTDKGDTNSQDGNCNHVVNDLSTSNEKEVNHTNCQSQFSHIDSSAFSSCERKRIESSGSLHTEKMESATKQENEQLTSSEADDIVEGSASNGRDLRALKTRLRLDLTLAPEGGGVKQCRQASEDKSCCQLRAAIEQVTELFDKIERVEHLYPNRQSLGEQNPKYKSEKFTRNFETLCLWLNVTSELYHKLHLIAKFVGVDPAETETWKDWLDVGLGKLGKHNIVFIM